MFEDLQPTPAPGDDEAPLVLLLEPSKPEGASTTRMLESYGFKVVVATTGRQAIDRLDNAPAVVLMEADLPDGDGFALCGQLKDAGARSVIFLSARAETLDRVAGLEFGADDYIAKPCHPLELLARVRAAVRRRREPAAAPSLLQHSAPSAVAGIPHDPWRQPVKLADCIFEVGTRRVCGPLGSVVLSFRQGAILRILLAAGGQIIAREELIRAAYGEEPARDRRAADELVSRLREKLRRCSAHSRLVQTAHRGGYYIALAKDAGSRAEPACEAEPAA